MCSSFSAGFSVLLPKNCLLKKHYVEQQQRNNTTKKSINTVTTAKMKQLFLNFAICFLVLHWMNCYEPNKSLIALFVLFLMHLIGLSPPQPNTRRFLVKVRAPFFCPKMTLIFKWSPFNKHWHSEMEWHVQIAVLLMLVNVVCLLFSMQQPTMRQFLVKVWVPFFAQKW